MWSYEAILAKLMEFAREGRDESDPPISPETRLSQIGGFDSLDVVEFVMRFEDYFKASIPDDQVGGDHTLDELARIINDYLR